MNSSAAFRHRMRNAVQAGLLLGGMGGLLAGVGWFLGGMVGVGGFVVLGIGFLLFSPRVSPGLILRMYGARALHPGEAPGLFRIVESLARRSGLERLPRLHYISSRAMNAFSVGRGAEASLALTDGLLRGLSQRELTGVLAHEVSHIRHNDIWIMGLADSMSRLVWMGSLFGQVLLLINLPMFLMSRNAMPWWPIVLLIAAPSVSALLQLGLSRNREFDADLAAAELTGDPGGLAMALERLEQAQIGLFDRLFRRQRQDAQPSMLRTHPASRERVQRLLEMAREPPPAAVVEGVLPLLPGAWPEVTRPPRRRWTGVRF